MATVVSTPAAPLSPLQPTQERPGAATDSGKVPQPPTSLSQMGREEVVAGVGIPSTEAVYRPDWWGLKIWVFGMVILAGLHILDAVVWMIRWF